MPQDQSRAKRPRDDEGGELPSSNDGEVIIAVERALRALQAFDHDHPSLTLSEMAELIGLSRGTTRRILLTFEQLGFIRRSGRQFSLTAQVLRLGYGYISSLPFWERAQPHLRELADNVEESSSIAVLDGSDIVYVARVPSRRQLTTVLTVGSRLPAHATSMGHVLLAGLNEHDLSSYLENTELTALTPRTIVSVAKLRSELQKVARKGYALSNGQRELGTQSVAAPISDRTGRVIAALNVSSNVGRVPPQEMRDRSARRRRDGPHDQRRPCICLSV